jgi:hypothetical protein
LCGFIVFHFIGERAVDPKVFFLLNRIEWQFRFFDHIEPFFFILFPDAGTVFVVQGTQSCWTDPFCFKCFLLNASIPTTRRQSVLDLRIPRIPQLAILLLFNDWKTNIVHSSASSLIVKL